jgi:hypothetical protein
LSFKTWQQGGFGFGFAIATGIVIMSVYLAIVAMLLNNGLVLVVEGNLAIQTLILTFCVTVVLTHVLGWAGVIGRIKQ